MQKVYLLLRNNQQNGPYNLEELLQCNLKPVDLVWIEGKSAGWYYPQEIEALRPYLPFVKPAFLQKEEPAISVQPTATVSSPASSSPKKIFVSMPVNSREEPPTKPLADRTFSQPAAPAYTPTSSTYEKKEPELLKTAYAKTLEEVESDYANWVYQKKTKKRSTVSKKGLIAACLLVSVAFGAWWLVRNNSPVNDKKAEPVAALPTATEVATDSSIAMPVTKAGVNLSPKKQKQLKTTTVIKDEIAAVKSMPEKQKKEVVLQKSAAPENDYEGAAPVKEEKKIIAKEKSAPPVADAPKESKKKLKEKFLDLFKKKNETPVAETKPAADEDGERRAARREPAADLSTQVTVKFEVPNEWMMGVKGARASLTNRSDETIVRAAVAVLYFNEDNDLLDKKTIYFSNVGAKKVQTISIPDQSFADHLDYKIISVQGAESVAQR